MMFKKCSNFHLCIFRGFNFIDTVYELFDNPSFFHFRKKKHSFFYNNACLIVYFSVKINIYLIIPNYHIIIDK